MKFSISTEPKKNYWIFILFGFILYGNTLFHDFALDDAIVITENQFTKKGFSGIWNQLTNDQFMGFYGEKKELVSGGRYRPLSMVLFNIEYALVGASPFLYHLINILFYILNGYLLYLVLHQLFKKRFNESPWISLALLASLIWFFHPIHTEVVANIKGRDEIMAFCGELITLLFILEYLEKKETKTLAWIAIAFFLALLSKENAITWLALIPVSLFIFRKDQVKEAITPVAILFGVAALWLFIRYQIVGGGISNVADNLMNDPFLESSVSQKYATIVFTLGKYIELLFFPHPLTFDYYPKHIPIVAWNNPKVIISLLIYIAFLLYGVYGLFKQKVFAFCIWTFIITLSIASNLVFPIGAFMNERFVYVSSLGFAIAVAYFLLFVLPKLLQNRKMAKQLILGLSITATLLYSIKTISRNKVWKDNLTLATNDAKISIRGAKSNVMAGGLMSEEAAKERNPQVKAEMLKESIGYLKNAVEIYPEYIDALLLMGNAQWEYTKRASYAFPYYQRILNINNQHQNTWQNLFIVLEQEKDVDYRIKAYRQLLNYAYQQDKIYLNLGRAYGREKQDLSSSIQMMEKGLEIAPNNYDLLTNLGTAYGLSQNYSKAIGVLKRAIQIQPNNAKTYIDLGLSYYYLNNLEKAKNAFDKASQIDPNVNRSQFPI